MGDQGMDGLDALMAELASAPKTEKSSAKTVASKTAAASKPPKPERKVIDGFDASGQLVLDDEADMNPRAQEFVKRLKIFQMRVADPSTRERLNKGLALSSNDYKGTTRYYEERPQLAAYTINTEISRMKYSVVPLSGGTEVTDVDSIRRLYAECCPGCASAALGAGGSGAGGAEKEVEDVELLFRLANQSLLAGLMQQLQDTFGQPEDVELCISIHNTTSAWVIDLPQRSVRAKTEFKVATVGVGDEAMLPLAHITGEIVVDVGNECVTQVIRDIRLLMVFDDDLEASARALAEGEARGVVYESPAKGRSLLVLRDGMLDVAGRGLELASSAKSVGGGLVSSALSTGSSFLSGLGSMVREVSGMSAASEASGGVASPSSAASEPIRLYNR